MPLQTMLKMSQAEALFLIKINAPQERGCGEDLGAN